MRDCRLCHGQLEVVRDFGEQAYAGVFPKPGERVPTAPLVLCRCVQCDLWQLSETVSREALFGGEYGYRSGINETMAAHLKRLALSLPLDQDEIVVDVGANDGTFLDWVTADFTMGFDPSNALRSSGERICVKDFFSSTRYWAKTDKAARAVSSLAMFYDVDDPIAFAKDVAEILEDGGTWLLEVQYLPTMLRQHAFDCVCHEHLTYWTLRQLKHVFDEAGFSVARMEFNQINGGSVCIWATKGKSAIVNWQFIKAYASETLDGTFHATDIIRGKILKFLYEAKLAKKTVWGYGASTKGNTFLQYCEIGPHDLVAIADRSPEKWGRVTPGTSISIASEDDLRSAKPDYVLALPWAFIDGFREREPWARFVTAIPELKVYEPKCQDMANAS